jgi:hypothetical protein
LDLCFLPEKGIGFCTQGSLSLPCLLAMKSSLVYFAFLARFSGSSSTSSLLEVLPLLVSALEIEKLLRSLPISEDSELFYASSSSSWKEYHYLRHVENPIRSS